MAEPIHWEKLYPKSKSVHKKILRWKKECRRYEQRQLKKDLKRNVHPYLKHFR